MTTEMTRPRRKVFDVLCQRPYGLSRPLDLYTASKDCAGFVERLLLSHRLPVHNGCVNTIWWNDAGTLLLSGSDDHHLKLTEPYSGKIVVDYKTQHRANIFSAKFLPFSNDAKVVSCSGDGAVLYTDLQDRPCGDSGRPAHLYLCPAGTTYEVLTWPTEPQCFLSCGEEGAVRCFDLRQHRACQVRGCTESILLWTERAITTMALNPMALWELAVATADGCVRLYDRRMLQPRQQGGEFRQWTAPGLQSSARRITAMQYAPGGRQLLVSYSADDVYLFDLSESEAAVAAADGQAGASAAAALPCRPAVKRLRLRGDWSDTGPEARPERQTAAAAERERSAEQQQQQQNQDQQQQQQQREPAAPDGAERRPRRSGVLLHANLINQMSDVLQRLLTSEMPSRPPGVPAAPAVDADRAPMPDLSRRPVTRRVMERIRQRRALNMEQMVQDLESLHTSPDESEPVAAAEGASTEPANGADTAAARMADANCAESGPSVEEEEDSVSAETRQDLAGGGAGAHNSQEVVRVGVDGLSVTGDASAPDGTAEAVPTCRAAAAEGHGSHGTVSKTNKPDDIPSEGGTSGATVAKESCSGATAPGVDSRNGPTPAASSCTGGAAVSPAVNLGGAAVGVGGGPALAPPPLGPYMDLETESVVVRSEPLVSLYYNPQSSTAGQISVESPHSPPGLARQADPDPCSTTFAERAMLLSCGSAQQPDCADDQRRQQQQQEEEERQAEDGVPQPHQRHCPPRVVARFSGHRNARTMIKEANFWGDDHVMSGSDCGHVFIWNRHTGRLVTILEADRHVVNCVQPHPLDPVLATSGIDYDIKLWAPLAAQSVFDPQRAEELVSRNAVMLEETRDTITVPASFMIRMLASLSSRRARQDGR